MSQDDDPSHDSLALRAFRDLERLRGHRHADEVAEFDCILATVAEFRAHRRRQTNVPAEATV